MEQRRVSVYLALSLDGYLARPDGGLDWLDKVQSPGEDYGYAEFFATVDGLVMGRSTYDTVLQFGAWPYGSKPVAVFTHRPDSNPPPGVSFHQGALLPLLDDWARNGRRHVYLDGGTLARQGLSEGIVDELTLSWVPVVLGSGRPLFAGGLPTTDWEVLSSRSWGSGLVQSHYRKVTLSRRVGV